MKFVEEKIVIFVIFLDATIGSIFIVNSEAPSSIMSDRWLKRYIKEAWVDENILEWENCEEGLD